MEIQMCTSNDPFAFQTWYYNTSMLLHPPTSQKQFSLKTGLKILVYVSVSLHEKLVVPGASVAKMS